jgi:Terpene cyclase DEP1
MKIKTIYLVLCFLGIALTYWQFVPWVAQNGLNMPLFFGQLFANRISAFFGMDVFVSAAALLVFMRTEASRLRIPGRWLPVTALILVGVSLALPLFLYLRERKLGQAQPVVTGQAKG